MKSLLGLSRECLSAAVIKLLVDSLVRSQIDYAFSPHIYIYISGVDLGGGLRGL